MLQQLFAKVTFLQVRIYILFYFNFILINKMFYILVNNNIPGVTKNNGLLMARIVP